MTFTYYYYSFDIILYSPMRWAYFAVAARGTRTRDEGDGPEKPLPYNRFFGADQIISACRVTVHRVRAPDLWDIRHRVSVGAEVLVSRSPGRRIIHNAAARDLSTRIYYTACVQRLTIILVYSLCIPIDVVPRSLLVYHYGWHCWGLWRLWCARGSK